MKKRIRMGLLILFIIALIPTVTAPYWYGTETGLISHWTCDGHFNDRISSNHGTQSGGVKIGSGAKGRGCVFDGVDDYVDVTDTTYGKDHSVLVWVYPKTNAGYQAIVSANLYAGWGSIDKSNTAIRAREGSGDHEILQDNGCSNNRWCHVAFTYNSSSRTGILFINGKNVTQDTSFDGLNTSYKQIGLGTGGLQDAFNGSIDEVRIYNRSLSASEISELYNSSKSYHLKLKTHPTQGLVDESGLVGHWTFDSKDGCNSTNATDISGEGNHGAVTGAVFTNEGRFKEGYSFDGVDDWINISNIISGNYTLSAWVKHETSGFNMIFGKYNVGYPYFAVYSDDRLIHKDSSGTTYTYTDTDAFTYNQWHYVALVKNGTNTSFYYNGEFKQSNITSGSADTWNMIGNYYNAVTLPFDGTIDEVRIYNRSLSAAEIADLYNGSKSKKLVLKTSPTEGLVDESGLVGYWKMDSSTSNSTHTFDSSPYGKDGTLLNGTYMTNGRFKEGYYFRGEGNGDAIQVSTTNYFDVSNGYTISAWSKFGSTDTAGTYKPIITCAGAVCIGGGYLSWYSHTFGCNTGVMFNSQNSSNQWAGQAKTSNIYCSNTWHHVVATNNGTYKAIYMNGELVNYTIYTGGIRNTSIINIGGNSKGTFDYEGVLDEIRIYNRPFSATEVAGLYNGTKSTHLKFYAVPG